MLLMKINCLTSGSYLFQKLLLQVRQIFPSRLVFTTTGIQESQNPENVAQSLGLLREHFLRKVKGGLRWVSGGLNPSPKPQVLKRESWTSEMKGDERTEQLLAACKAGSNILLHSDAQAGAARR